MALRKNIALFGVTFAMVLAITGCASLSPPPVKISSVPADRVLAPVSLAVNAGQIVSTYDVPALSHLQQNFVRSGLFRDVALGIGQYPRILRVDFTADCNGHIGEQLGGIAAAATLYVVPHPVTCRYQLQVKVYQFGRLTAERHYSADYTKVIGVIYGQTHFSGDSAGADTVFSSLVDDFIRNPPIPLDRDTQREPDKTT